MSDSKYDLLVIGSEPGALWLLGQLHQSLPATRLAHLKSDALARAPVAVDARVAQEYSLPLENPWSVEIATPSGNFLWERETLLKNFTRLDPELFNNPTLKGLGVALTRHPELLGLCQGLWKRFSRVQTLTPETYLKALLQDRFTWWQPRLPEAISQATIAGPESITEIDFLERGEFSVTFDGQTWDTKHIVVALSFPEIEKLSSHHPLIRSALASMAMRGDDRGLVPVSLSVKEGFVPSVLAPVTLIFDSVSIPDPETEIHAIDCEHAEATRLTMWVRANRPIDLEAVTAKAQEPLARLRDKMPFLDQGTLETTIPLDGKGRKGSQETAQTTLERGFIPQFARARLHSHHTRNKQLSWIAPDHHCHLRYPAGSFRVAREIYTEVVGKKVAKRLTHPSPQT